MRAALAAVPPGERATHSIRIVAHLNTLLSALQPTAVLLYASFPEEPDLTTLAQALLARDVVIAVPRVNWADRSMQARHIRRWPQDFNPDAHGLPTPNPDCTEIPLASLDVILMPGLAFDRVGCRLGRGAGFYDRWLATPGFHARRIGIAFDVQIVHDVPTDPHDVRVHQLVSESGVWTINPPASQGI